MRSSPMKYMLLIYGNESVWTSMPPEQTSELIRETDALNRELFESGELVGAYGVADQVDAKMVRTGDGAPAVTDGPFLEAQEYLASFPIVDCESHERAREIAARNPAPRFVGRAVREPPHEADLPRGRPRARPRTCCAAWPRRSSPPSCAASGTSTRARTPCRRRSSPPRCSGPSRARPPTRRAGCSRSPPDG